MEAKERLMELYRIAVANGVVKNRKQFAALIHTAEGTLSNSLNGAHRYLGTASTLVTRAEKELKERGISISGDDSGNTQIGDNNTVGLSPKKFEHEQGWIALMEEKDRQISRLLTIIERLTDK